MATCLAGAGAPARLTASGRSARGLVRLQMACTLPRAVPAVPRLAVHVQPRTATSCAAAAACAGPAQPSPLPGRPSDAVISSLAVLCRNVLVGVAAAVAWSVAASAIAPGSTAPLASLSLAGSGPSGSGASVAAQSAWAGLAAGFLHTLCGPDHLAALTPLTIGRGRAAATALGALWGFGHSTGQLILGLVFVVLKDRFHDLVPALSKWSGTVVGLTLIAIGVMGIYETYFEGEGDAAESAEAGELKLAVAGAGADGAAAGSSGLAARARMGLATYATGIVYGLHPDALFVVVPALALPTKLAAIAYVTAFVGGTVSAMAGYTAVIGTTSAALTKERPWLQAHLSSAASGVAILAGVGILASGLGIGLPALPGLGGGGH